ncbi:hypothetical protein OHA10_26040 [Kribbella sp. NBC_00662]|uniref:hypothetical protein n=1 Tax=Kribbella sp. NBC_00662 TaxID=2975969 RepID=UPI00324CE2EB
MSKEPVGSVAEEAAKLFAVLQDAAGTPRDEEKHEHKLGPDCVWCPVCQLIHKVRNTSPETIEQLSTAAAQVLGSLRSLLEAAADAARQAREDAASRPKSPVQPEEEPAPLKVDRIDVSEDPEPWD